MARFDELKKKLLEDGIIDANEAAMLRQELYADGVIDREEADFLFELNDATSGSDNDPSWRQLFVDAISAHVLEDQESPNMVDDEEAQWLIARIEGDGTLDENERALLRNLQAKASSLPQSLKSKLE